MTKKMNESLIRQINLAKVKNHSLIEKGTGIDKSTISLHLNSKRPLSIEHAKAYAKYLEIPLIKILDDTVVKYRVVKYANDLGEVTNPTEEDFDIILAPNEIENSHQYAIYNKDRNSVYWYCPRITCSNADTTNQYAYIKTDDISYLGHIIKYSDEDKNIVEFLNVHTNKKMKIKCNLCYPITGITFCDFATVTKVENQL